MAMQWAALSAAATSECCVSAGGFNGCSWLQIENLRSAELRKCCTIEFRSSHVSRKSLARLAPTCHPAVHIVKQDHRHPAQGECCSPGCCCSLLSLTKSVHTAAPWSPCPAQGRPERQAPVLAVWPGFHPGALACSEADPSSQPQHSAAGMGVTC